jgi:hypothetical protein
MMLSFYSCIHVAVVKKKNERERILKLRSTGSEYLAPSLCRVEGCMKANYCKRHHVVGMNKHARWEDSSLSFFFTNAPELYVSILPTNEVGSENDKRLTITNYHICHEREIGILP